MKLNVLCKYEGKAIMQRIQSSSFLSTQRSYHAVNVFSMIWWLRAGLGRLPEFFSILLLNNQPSPEGCITTSQKQFYLAVPLSVIHMASSVCPWVSQPYKSPSEGRNTIPLSCDHTVGMKSNHVLCKSCYPMGFLNCTSLFRNPNNIAKTEAMNSLSMSLSVLVFLRVCNLGSWQRRMDAISWE